jgi:DNA polymerase III alpha subunit (gram-positive type)
VRLVDDELFMRKLSNISNQVEGLNYTVANQDDYCNTPEIIERRKVTLEKEFKEFLKIAKGYKILFLMGR